MIASTVDLDGVIEQAISDKRIVGCVVLVARDGEIVYQRAAGLADRESGRSMEFDAIFRLASVTKSIVTAAAMRLVEEGRLDLNDFVTKRLPEFRPSLPSGETPEITIHQLLTHTSGLSYSFLESEDGPYHRLNISDGLDQPGLAFDENLRRLSMAALYFQPGTGWRYSLGIDVLGRVLEKTTGLSLPEVVAKCVTDPLGMGDTLFSVRDVERLVTPYADGKPEPVRMEDGMAVYAGETAAIFAPSRALNPASYSSGGAGMAGTASDILRFLEVIRCGGAPLLSQATVDQMTTDQVGAQAQTQGPGWGFGYGWAVLDNPALTSTPQSAGTYLWGGAYGHYWFVDPAKAMTVVALTNTAFEGMWGAFTTEIRDAVYA